jgi:hypothetical protein
VDENTLNLFMYDELIKDRSDKGTRRIPPEIRQRAKPMDRLAA